MNPISITRGSDMAKKIAVANIKGGIGKTSTAIALVDGLRAKNKKVLLIDGDPHSLSASRVYKAVMDNTETLADIMYDSLDARKAVQTTEYGDIIPGDKELTVADTRIAADAERFYHLADACKKLDSLYDYIIIDCPPGNGVILGNVLVYVNEVVIPITCDSFGIQCLNSFGEILESYKKRLNESLKVTGVLITMYEGRQALTKDLEDNVIPKEVKALGSTLFKTRIRKSVRLKESQTLSQPIFEYAKKSTVAEDYQAFVNEFIRRSR